MLSTQTVHGQVSSPTHVYTPLAVMEADVPGSWVSKEARKTKKKKDETVYTVKSSWTRMKSYIFEKDKVEKTTL